MGKKRYSIIALTGIITLTFVLVYIIANKDNSAYAGEITDATVTTNQNQAIGTDTTTSTDSTTTADALTTVTNRAPVSIAVYSNEVTESSDTFDYTSQVTTGSQINDSIAVPYPLVNNVPPANSVTNSIDISTSGTTGTTQDNAISEAPVTDTTNDTVTSTSGNVTTTPTPSTNTTQTTTTVARDPRSTAAPDATEEPDMISYPATVAPAYKD